MSKIWYIPSLREPIYRKYSIKINNGGYYVSYYFDSKKEMLNDLMLYKKNMATPYILKQNKYILFKN
jgi:Fe-S-cluster containining protein